MDLTSIVLLSAWAAAAASVPSVLLSRAARPTAALSWILALFALPGVGLLAWWMLGRNHLVVRTRQRRRREATIRAAIEGVAQDPGGTSQPTWLPKLPQELRTWVAPPSRDNEVRLLPSAQAAYRAWEDAITGATAQVHALFYIWRSDASGRRMRDALCAAAARGVRVRVLLDGVGTPTSSFFRPLIEAGGAVEWFLPPWRLRQALAFNFRNHRKILVVDDALAYAGGINIGDEYLEWVDSAVEVGGSSAAQLNEVFCDDWYFATGEDIVHQSLRSAKTTPGSAGDTLVATVAGGPHQRLNAIREVMLATLATATERIWLTTPYFIPDDGLLTVLRIAVYRGVDVRILVPARSDSRIVRRASRAYYPELLAAGVRVFEHQRMVHAKTALIDHRLSCVGSTNLDQRSFRLNFEVTTIVESEELNGALEREWEELAQDCVEVDAEDYERLPLRERAIDALLHLGSPLL